MLMSIHDDLRSAEMPTSPATVRFTVTMNEIAVNATIKNNDNISIGHLKSFLTYNGENENPKTTITGNFATQSVPAILAPLITADTSD